MESSSKGNILDFSNDDLCIISNQSHPLLLQLEQEGKKLKTSKVERSKTQKFAMFDMDYTLIKTKSGKIFAQSWDDWKPLFNNIKETLTEFLENDFRLVIITNQSRFEKDPRYKKEVLRKIRKIMGFIDLPVDFIVLQKDTEYRKPSPGVLYFMMKYMYPDVHFDFENSFYCGDAAGRLKTALRKKDFANT